MIEIDKLSADRLREAAEVFDRAYEWDYEHEPWPVPHCWICDALKPSWDSACSCDNPVHYRPDE